LTHCKLIVEAHNAAIARLKPSEGEEVSEAEVEAAYNELVRRSCFGTIERSDIRYCLIAARRAGKGDRG
jgi:Xaa-Pro aminopeptidase